MPEKTQTTGTTNENSNPWQPQQNYLLDAFNKAQGIYNSSAGNLYNGPQVAQFSPDQLSLFRSMMGYGSNSSLPGQIEGAGSTMTGAGAGAVTGALGGLSSFAPQGGPDSNVQAAGLYADNPYIGGQVDAAMRDARRQVTESTMPQIARSAALSGNTDSSARAISEGIVNRGLADKAGDISSNLRGNAFNTGLGLAETGRQFDNNARLNALSGAGSLGSSAFGSGIGALGGSIDAARGLYDIAGAGGSGAQQAGQAGIDDARMRSEYGGNRMNDLMSRYYGIVGSNNWGGNKTGTTTGEQTKTASPLTLAGSLLGGIGQFGYGMPGMTGMFGRLFPR